MRFTLLLDRIKVSQTYAKIIFKANEEIAEKININYQKRWQIK